MALPRAEDSGEVAGSGSEAWLVLGQRGELTVSKKLIRTMAVA